MHLRTRNTCEKNTKTMNWSFSVLKQFNQCPRQFYEMRVAKNYPKEDTQQALYGRELHKAAENYILDTGQPIDPRFKFMQPIIDAMLWKKGKRQAEFKMAVTQTLVPCAWDSEQAWCRGVADLLIVDEKLAWVVDWKTGNAKYPDRDQLVLMSLLVFAYYPEVQYVNSALLFVLHNTIIKHKVRREDAPALWWKFREDVALLEAAHACGLWQPRQSGLCKRHCPCTGCEFNGKYFDKPREGEYHALHKQAPSL